MIDFEFGSFSVLQLQICNDSAILMVVVDTDMFVFKMATFPLVYSGELSIISLKKKDN
jgi:hypothetical protein